MKKLLCSLLLSFFILLPQASAETLVDTDAQELYNRVVQINASLDENYRLTSSELAKGETPNSHIFDMSKDKTFTVIILESNQDGKIERVNCIGSIANQNAIETLYRSTAMVMQSVGLTAEEWNALMDSKNQVRDENSFSSSIFASELNKDVVMLTMTMGNGIVGTSLSVK